MPKIAYQTMIKEVGWTRRKIILVNDPEIVQHIMTAEVADYPKSDLMAGALAPLVRDSVFVSNGEVWERQRRVISPAFSHMRLGNAFTSMAAAIDLYEETFDRYAETGEEFSLEAAMSNLTADIICRTIFSKTLGGEAAQRVYKAFADFQDSVANVRVFRLWLGRAFDDISQPVAVTRAATEIREQIGVMLDEREADTRSDLSDIAGDIMKATDPRDGSAFTREELVDHIGVFFLAGHETTAGALAWAFYILAHQPDAVRGFVTKSTSSRKMECSISKLSKSSNSPRTSSRRLYVFTRPLGLFHEWR